MSDENMLVVERLLKEVWSNGKLSLLPELIADDFVGHTTSRETTIHGIEQYRQRIALYKEVFPEILFTIEDQFASGDKVATRWSARARLKKELEPTRRDQVTGEPISVSGINIRRLQAGKIVESWENWDELSLLESSSIPDLLDMLSVTSKFRF